MPELIGVILAVLFFVYCFSGNEENPIDRGPVSKGSDKNEKGAHEKNGTPEPSSTSRFTEVSTTVVVPKAVPAGSKEDGVVASLLKRAIRGNAPTYSHSLGAKVATPRRGRRVLAKIVGFHGRQLVLRHYDGLVVRRSPMNIFSPHELAV